jgi:Ca2+-binding RTX toxin-like protein
MSSRTRIAAVAVLAAATVAFPGVARSAVVSSDGTTVTVTESTPGEANDITVSVDDPGTLRVYESFGPETPQGLCTYNDVTEIVECPLGPGGVQVSAGAGNDKVYSMILGAGSLPDGAVVVDLGPGNDFFKGSDAGEKVAGGDGTDELNGWGGPDVLDGGAGDDKLDGEKGGDTLLGGDGNDFIDDDHYAEPTADVIDGGPGLDELEAYTPSDSDARNAPAINVTLGGGADDGKPGEGDDVRNVEVLDLGSAGTIVADDAANEILLPETGAASTVQALGGNDRVVAGDADLDRIDGGAGDDELIGGFGDDTIVGGPGKDRIRGDRPARCNELHCDYGSGFGADTIDARDGEADSVSCGPGVDSVKADALDVVDTDCENVDRGPAGPPPGPGTDERAPVVKFGATPPSLRRGVLAASGLTVTNRSDEAGTATVVLVLDAKTARRLGVPAKLATAKARVAAGSERVKLRLAPARARKVRIAGAFNAKVQVTVVDGAGNRSLVQRRLAVKR